MENLFPMVASPDGRNGRFPADLGSWSCLQFVGEGNERDEPQFLRTWRHLILHCGVINIQVTIAFPLLLFPLVANIFISSISWCCNVTPLNTQMTLGFNSEWLDNIYASPTVRRAQLQTNITVTHLTGPARPAIRLPALSQYFGFYKLKIVKHLQMLSPLTLTWP